MFISYARDDAGVFARQLADDLRKADFEPWLEEETLVPGENWGMASGRALESSDAIVVLISHDSLRSKWVESEWNFAISSPKHAGRVIPVLTPGTSAKTAPWILKHMDHLTSGQDWKKTAKKVVAALSDLEERD